MTEILDTILLFALPASGKSEVRHYLDGLSAEQCLEEFHMGPTLQLDDYPYVHFMHRIDDELHARGRDYIFYKGPHRPFQNEFEWGTLVALLNEDFHDLMERRTVNPPSASQHLFDRIDAARTRVGLEPVMGDLPYRIRCQIAETMEEETAKELAGRNKTTGQDRTNKTIVIEAARGGPNGAAFPLTPPHGYDYTLSLLSSEILDRAVVLYVWVSPEESRRKNVERGRPDGQGSILHHSVPLEVMLGQYGCDDMDYLIGRSGRPDTIKVERIETVRGPDKSAHYEMHTWHLPVARFDNRQDLTSFVRNDRSMWKPDEIERLHGGLKQSFEILARLSRSA